MLRDYLSPDIWREYGPREADQQGGGATASTSRGDPQEEKCSEVTSGGGGEDEEPKGDSLEPSGESGQREMTTTQSS